MSASEYFAYLTPSTVGGDHRRSASGKARSLRKWMESTLRYVDSGRQGRDPPKGESMKRHPSLRQFSDDHHQGLVNARRLRRAASGEGASSADTARDFLDFWQRDTSLHFRKEEEVLLPVLARYEVTKEISASVPYCRCSPSTLSYGALPCSSATNSSRTRSVGHTAKPGRAARGAHPPGRARGVPPHRGIPP